MIKLNRVGVYAFDPVTKQCACGLTTCDSPGKHPTKGPPPDGWTGGYGAKVDDFLVLDVDPKSGGPETLRQLITVLGPLPMDTPRVATGDYDGVRGTHYYFAKPKGITATKTRGHPASTSRSVASS